jgi:triosephosphate isomerase
MNMTPTEAIQFAKDLRAGLIDFGEREVAVAPPFISIYPVAQILKGTDIHLCAQNMFWEEKGAYTGEISPLMLIDAGCRYVIVGHSERRQYFGENNGSINLKIRSALSHGLHPILCVGESIEQRERGETFRIIELQLNGGLSGIDEIYIKSVIIAYEPIWAIGTGKTANPQQAQEVHSFIRKYISDHFGQDAGLEIRIQYGGSVTPENIDDLMAMPDIDGALVGGASLRPESFIRIVQYKGMKKYI